MSTSQELPTVGCSVEGCAYHHEDTCHAASVTIGGVPGDANCVTFIPLDERGGLDNVIATVGACQRADCTHNDALVCGAAAVAVGAGQDNSAHADCLTYEAS
ncbi:MAG: DUF1540 domain-containing protein [Cellulomonadaceae bacterium]|nr:DUF1540 domain-containing protein [Cellulomonadaceae bacterium]